MGAGAATPGSAAAAPCCANQTGLPNCAAPAGTATSDDGAARISEALAAYPGSAGMKLDVKKGKEDMKRMEEDIKALAESYARLFDDKDALVVLLAAVIVLLTASFRFIVNKTIFFIGFRSLFNCNSKSAKLY
jgi:hypothetical protein